MQRNSLLLPFFLLTCLAGSDAMAVMPQSHYSKAAENSQIKAVARVEKVLTLDNGKRYSAQKTTFTLIKPYFGTSVPQRFTGSSNAVLKPWQNPGAGGEVFLYPRKGDVVFVTISEDGGRITSYTKLTDALEQALEKAPETIRFGMDSAYIGSGKALP